MAKYTPQQVAEKVAGHPAWHHRFEVASGVFTPGCNDSKAVLKHLQLPQDCTGLRVLDIGARDFSNWWGFKTLCLRRLVESANFTVDRAALEGDRAVLKCRIAEDKELSLWTARERGLQNQESLGRG
jgi:hypothetical protein